MYGSGGLPCTFVGTNIRNGFDDANVSHWSGDAITPKDLISALLKAAPYLKYESRTNLENQLAGEAGCGLANPFMVTFALRRYITRFLYSRRMTDRIQAPTRTWQTCCSLCRWRNYTWKRRWLRGIMLWLTSRTRIFPFAKKQR